MFEEMETPTIFCTKEPNTEAMELFREAAAGTLASIAAQFAIGFPQGVMTPPELVKPWYAVLRLDQRTRFSLSLLESSNRRTDGALEVPCAGGTCGGCERHD